jgi:hypothetical protein
MSAPVGLRFSTDFANISQQRIFIIKNVSCLVASAAGRQHLSSYRTVLCRALLLAVGELQQNRTRQTDPAEVSGGPWWWPTAPCPVTHNYVTSRQLNTGSASGLDLAGWRFRPLGGLHNCLHLAILSSLPSHKYFIFIFSSVFHYRGPYTVTIQMLVHRVPCLLSSLSISWQVKVELSFSTL